MAGFILTVPKQYRARLGGKAKISVSGDTERDARGKLVDYGIPYAATNSFGIEPQSQTRVDGAGREYTDLRDFGEAGRSAAKGSTLLSDIKKKGGPSLVDSGVPGGGALGANTGTFKEFQGNIAYAGNPAVFNPSGEQGGVSQFSPNSNYKPKTATDYRKILLQAKNKRTQDALRAKLLATRTGLGLDRSESGTTGNSALGIDDMVASQGINLGGKGDGGIEEPPVEPPVVVEPKGDPVSFDSFVKNIENIGLYAGGTFDSSPFESQEFWNSIFSGYTTQEINQLILDDPMGGFGDTGDKQIAEAMAAKIDVIAKKIIATQPNSFEGKKAVKAFLREAELQSTIRSKYDMELISIEEMQDNTERGFSTTSVGDLVGEDGRTFSQNVNAQSEPANLDEVSVQFESDPKQFNSDLDLQLNSAGYGSATKPSSSDVTKNYAPKKPLDLGTGGGSIGGEGEGFFPDSSTQAFRNQTTDIETLPQELKSNFNPNPGTNFNPNPNTGQSGQIAIQDIINSFEQLNPGQTTTYQLPMLDGEGVVIPGRFTTVVNPLLESLLDSAELNNGYVNQATLSAAQNTTAVAVAQLQKDEAVAVAYQQGVSAADIATIQQNGDYNIAVAQQIVDKHIANQQLAGTEAQADATTAAAQSAATGTIGAAQAARFGKEAAAESAAGATTAAAESMAGGQVGAAEAAAAAASPFGFMSQNYDHASRDTDLTNIYKQINQVGLAQAAAAQDNPYGYAASQTNPVTGAREFRPNELAQIGANTPAAFAAQGQEAAARAGATGFGALLSGDAMQQGNANAILRAQAANNPYAATQLGQDNSRIDQILRGGLSPEQRIAEINASQAGQNFANQLNFMSNPSAVGFATEQGLFGGGNNQVLQDINNSPEGMIPGSTFGFNSPTAAGAGGGQTTTANTDNFNPNLSTFKNASPEQIGFYQGMQSAGGQTPREVQDSMESFTPQGVGY